MLATAASVAASGCGSNSATQIKELKGTIAALSSGVAPSAGGTDAASTSTVPSDPGARPARRGALALNLHQTKDMGYGQVGFVVDVDVTQLYHVKGYDNAVFSVTVHAGSKLTADTTRCCSKLVSSDGAIYDSGLGEGPDSISPGGTGQFLLPFRVPDSAALRTLSVSVGSFYEEVDIPLGNISLGDVPMIDASQLPALQP